MLTIKKLGLSFLIASLFFSGFARTFYVNWLEPAGVNDPIVPGEWHLGWKQCKAYAEANELPMLAVWGNLGCDHCYNLEQLFITDAFKKWRTESPKGKIVLCIMAGGESGYPDQVNSDGFNWAGGPWPGASWYVNAYPFVALYWKVGGKEITNYHTSGDDFVGTANVPTRQVESYAEQLTAKIESYFPDFPLNKDSGMSFTVTEGLEAEVGKTTYVNVPLSRTNAWDFVETNIVNVIRNGKRLYSVTNGWEKGDKEMVSKVTIDPSWKPGDMVQVELLGSDGKVLGTNTVNCVAPIPNSAANPSWMKASEAELAFGEWTMDLDTATNKTRHASGDAYTLVFFSGVLWCPHCKGLERQVFASDAFKAYALENQMSFVVLDNPRRSATDNRESMIRSLIPDGPPPTLLRYAEGVVDTSSGKMGSGTSYLSRNMISTTEAERILLRNHLLGYFAWRLPDSFRTGYPSVLLLDKKGRIVGRLAYTEITTKVDTDGQTVGVYDADITMRRLRELVALAKRTDDEAKTEERNRNWSTTPLVISAQSAVPVTGSLDANDTMDTVQIVGNTERVRVECSAEGSAPATVKFIHVDEFGLETVVSEISGDLSTNLSVSASCEDGSNYVAIVANTSSNSPFFAHAKVESVRYWSMSTIGVIVPGDDEKERVFPAGTQDVTVQLTRGKVYRIEGLAEGFTSPTLVKIENSDNLYRANANEDAVLPLPATPGEHTVRVRIWETGEVGFSVPEMTVEEKTAHDDPRGFTEVTIQLARTGGASGKVSGTVKLLADESTVKPEDGRFYWEGDGSVEWADGDSEGKTLSFVLFDDEFYDPLQTLVFSLELSADSLAGIAENLGRLTVYVKDDDKVAVGKLAIVACRPAFSREMSVVAGEGDTLSVTVRRENGSSSAVSAKLELVADGETVATTAPYTWLDGQRQADHVFTLAVPGGHARGTLRIVPTGIKADSARGAMTVHVVAADAPSFAGDPEVDYHVYGNVAAEESVIALENVDSGTVMIEKTSGELPAGISATYEEGRGLVLSGTPIEDGAYSAVFQVSVMSAAGVARGRTVALNFNVADFLSAAGRIVPSILTPHTYVNEPVFDDAEPRAHLLGLLSLAVPPNGRASAKFVCEAGTSSYAADGWSELNEKDRVVRARLMPTSGCGREMTLTVDADGIATVEFLDPTDPSESRSLCATCYERQWPTGGAQSWKGIYTVQLPQLTPVPGVAGDGFVVLKMSDNSVGSCRMTYVGGLPDGRTFSGSSVLTPTFEGAELPVFHFGAGPCASAFTAELSVAPGAADDTTGIRGWVRPASGTEPYWIVRHGETGDASAMEAYGGRPDVDLAAICQEVYSSLNLSYCLTNEESLVGTSYGDLDQFYPTGLELSGGTFVIDGANPHRLRVQYSPETGIVTGTVMLPFTRGTVAGTYRGVVLPGWDACGGCGREDPTIRASRPLLSGSIWFDDVTEDGVEFSGGCGFRVGQRK